MDLTQYLKSIDIGENLSDLFSVACALYWHCADYHGGQNSELYRILSQLDYQPGMAECGPEADSTDETIYNDLASGMINPVELYEWFEGAYARVKARGE